jgi:hypothetical protein
VILDNHLCGRLAVDLFYCIIHLLIFALAVFSTAFFYWLNEFSILVFSSFCNRNIPVELYSWAMLVRLCLSSSNIRPKVVY